MLRHILSSKNHLLLFLALNFIALFLPIVRTYDRNDEGALLRITSTIPYDLPIRLSEGSYEFCLIYLSIPIGILLTQILLFLPLLFILIYLQKNWLNDNFDDINHNHLTSRCTGPALGALRASPSAPQVFPLRFAHRRACELFR